MTPLLRPMVALLVCLGGARTAAAQRPADAAARVGVVLDGPSSFTDSVLVAFQREVTQFFGTDGAVTFPPRATIHGDWTPAGINTAIDRLLADADVDLVVALGPIASHEVARRHALAKPAIAAVIIDAALQELPAEAGASGVRNLNYVNVAYSASRALPRFLEVVGFHRLAVLIHPGLVSAAPQFVARAAAEAGTLGITLDWVPVAGSASEALRAMPPGVDAAFVTPFEQLPPAAVDSVISALTARRLPTFAYTGRPEIERGVLVSYAPRDDLARRARRVAGNIQRILHGEDAGTLPVDLTAIPQLTLNMATARAIGFSPGWSTLTEAELVNAEPPAAGPTRTLASVVRDAVSVNLDILAAGRVVGSGREEVRVARAGLLPQVQASATGTAIREETAGASLGRQAQQQADGSVVFSQAVIDDQTWARFGIERHLQTGREADRRRVELDVALQAATAFLDVLRAQASARVEHANLRVTRSNLEVALLRERTGASSRADVYRWESQLASSRRSVIAADASVQVVALELNRVLNRPLEEPFQAQDATLTDSLLLTSDPRLFDYLGTAETFAVFREFMVVEGQRASPELQALDAAIAAQRRAATAAGRSLWLPTVALEGGISDVLWRGGTGAQPPAIGGITLGRGPDLTWSVRLGAALPLFAGFARTATRSQATIELDRLAIEREAVALAVGQQIRAALLVAGASWAGIEQARSAAEAARRNFELVSDAYASGTASIITLLDAQQAALTSGEAAATAVYDFLADLMTAERATGEFNVLRTADERRALFDRLEDFFRAAGVTPRPH